MKGSDLSGLVAIVSGASRGIGEAAAWAMAKAGAKVVISSRKFKNIGPVADEINKSLKGQALAVAAHAGKAESGEILVSRAVEQYGRVDIVVNNAGTNPHFGPLLEATESQWDKILEVNVKGYFWLCRAAARQMQEQGDGGKIINVASVAGLQPSPMLGVYSVSKAAIIMLTKVLAVELASDNIQVNALAPGFVKTRFSQALWGNKNLKKAIIEHTPAGRIAEKQEIVEAIVYLASSGSNFITGAVLTVDGGYTLL
jgi:NAD(P)-dependent dehydrogenase (short-subunit alcohol dehydrogenase family)